MPTECTRFLGDVVLEKIVQTLKLTRTAIRITGTLNDSIVSKTY